MQDNLQKKRREPNKKALMLYYDEILAAIEDLSLNEIGALFKTIAYYDIYGSPIDDTVSECSAESKIDARIVKSWGKRFAATLDRDLIKYKESCEYRQTNRAMQEQQRYGINGVRQGRFTFETEEGKAKYKVKFGDCYPHQDIPWQMIIYNAFS